jgi:hypothetical protein
MTIFLDRIDSAPIINSDFDTQFLQWIWVLVDSLNETINDIENAFNLLTAQSYTAAEIVALQTAIPSQLSNGVLLYDTTNNVYVGKQSGALVKFTTAAYP